jgi:predicted ATPase
MTTTSAPTDHQDHEQSPTGHILNLDLPWSDPRALEQHQYAQQQARIRHELTLAFSDLGGATFALARHGALSGRRLAGHIQRIEELYAQLAEFDETDGDHALSRTAT